MINRGLHDCEKSSSSTKSIPLKLKHPIILDEVSENDPHRLPNKKFSTTLRHIASKHVPGPTENACNSCLQRPARIRRRALQRAKYHNDLIHDKELQSQGIAERVLATRYIAQKCIQVRITGR